MHLFVNVPAKEADMAPTTSTPAPALVASGFHFLEAPRWRENRIWFSDFYGHQVFSVREDGSDLRTEATVEQQPSGLGWLPDGRLLVVSMLDKKILRREPDGTLVTHADLSAHATGLVNDMLVDATGRVYVGNFGFDLMGGAAAATASLHRVDPDGTVTEVADDLWFPNGMVLTADGVLIVDETFGNRCSAFDVTADGRLVNRRVWASFGPVPAGGDAARPKEPPVGPDGCCPDAEGAVWIADCMGGRLLRVSEGGTITGELRPGTGVYACALGGADGKTLFACAAPDHHAKARSAAREASLVAFRVEVPAAR
jgi:sugar lactone lactonase YvrE